MKKTLVLCLVLCAGHYLYAQSPAVRAKHFNLKKKMALQGYDPVSYFKNGPKKGLEQHQYTHGGVVYYFANPQNREEFSKAPEQYEPQYGGWCAYAIGATGDKVKIDPETYKIVDNKLFLFYNFRGHNTLPEWNKDEENLKPAADRYWSEVVQ